jgi:hypothetical protein
VTTHRAASARHILLATHRFFPSTAARPGAGRTTWKEMTDVLTATELMFTDNLFELSADGEFVMKNLVLSVCAKPRKGWRTALR